MASLLRLGLRQGRSLKRFTPVTQQVCSIKTTNKKTGATPGGDVAYDHIFHPDAKKHGVDDRMDKDENWISYGYNVWDREEDTFEKHISLFGMITIGFCGTMFVMMYIPDFKLRDWAQREAFLQIEERERKGLPLVDPNYLPPEKIEQQLPTDEELGDTEIIV